MGRNKSGGLNRPRIGSMVRMQTRTSSRDLSLGMLISADSNPETRKSSRFQNVVAGSDKQPNPCVQSPPYSRAKHSSTNQQPW